MNNMLAKIEAVDLIALVCISGGMILMYLRVDGVVSGILVLIAGYYFGHKRKNEDTFTRYGKM